MLTPNVKHVKKSFEITSIEYHKCYKRRHSITFAGIFILCERFSEHVRFIYYLESQHREQNKISVTLQPTVSKIVACFSALMFNIFPRLN